MAAPSLAVAVYELDRVYGGPEEGGWWYDAGTHVRTLRTFRSEERAYAFARRVNRSLAFKREQAEANGWQRPLSSVAYDGGHLAAEVHTDPPPAGYPNSRPFYE